MNLNFVMAAEVATELGLYLKIVTATKAFDNYNSFFNIYSEIDEPCRRILVLTPYKDLEEVNDDSPSEPIKKYEIIDGNLWIEEYSLRQNPNKILLDNVQIPKEIYVHFKNTMIK